MKILTFFVRKRYYISICDPWFKVVKILDVFARFLSIFRVLGPHRCCMRISTFGASKSLLCQCFSHSKYAKSSGILGIFEFFTNFWCRDAPGLWVLCIAIGHHSALTLHGIAARIMEGAHPLLPPSSGGNL